jgi:hypothetical protein
MANTFITPSIVAKQALATLYETTVAALLVHRDYEADFQAKVGTTISVRKPATFTAQEFTTTISVQNAIETSVPVVLNHFADVSFSITSADLTLRIEDFATQLLNPAMEAISQKIDQDVLSLRDDIAQEIGVAGGVTTGVAGTNTYAYTNPRTLIDARRVLNLRNIPPSERYAIVGPNIEAAWLGDDLLNRADARGDTDGLRDASLGRRLFGIEPYQSQNVDDDPEIGVAFHRTAFALVTRPLALPRGAKEAAVESYKGFGLRVVFDYDIETKSDICSVDCLYGTKCLDANRAVLITGSGS